MIRVKSKRDFARSDHSGDVTRSGKTLTHTHACDDRFLHRSQKLRRVRILAPVIFLLPFFKTLFTIYVYFLFIYKGGGAWND